MTVDLLPLTTAQLGPHTLLIRDRTTGRERLRIELPRRAVTPLEIDAAAQKALNVFRRDQWSVTDAPAATLAWWMDRGEAALVATVERLVQS